MPQFKLPRSFTTIQGVELPDAEIHYEIFGNPEGELIWICHALTGSAAVTEWWPTLFKEAGGAIDLKKHRVVCANSFGSCYGSKVNINNDFKNIEIHHRDVINAFELLRNHLKIEAIDWLIGGSLGGQQALEWSVSYPQAVKNLLLIATNAKQSGWAAAWNDIQRHALSLANNLEEACVLARKIAMISYRTYADFNNRVELESLPIESISSYLNYQGHKFNKRFSSESYRQLSIMMDTHDISMARSGDVIQHLKKVEANTLVIGIESDLLFPLADQQYLAEHIPHSELLIIHSQKGHDAFLLEGNFISKCMNISKNKKLALT